MEKAEIDTVSGPDVLCRKSVLEINGKDNGIGYGHDFFVTRLFFC
jgi:hypothetical protein